MEAASVPAEGSAGASGAAEGGEQSQEGAQPDYGPLLEQMDSRLQQFGENFMENLGADEGYEDDADYEGDDEYGDDPFGLEGAEGMYDDEGEMDPRAAHEFLGNMIESKAAEIAQQQMEPLMERMTELSNAHNAEALIQEYPQLGNPEVAGEVTQRALQQAHAMGADEQNAAVLVQNPEFLRLVIKAGMADQHAAGDGGSELDLESGATAGQGQPPTNLGREIVNAGGAKSSFWGVG